MKGQLWTKTGLVVSLFLGLAAFRAGPCFAEGNDLTGGASPLLRSARSVVLYPAMKVRALSSDGQPIKGVVLAEQVGYYSYGPSAGMGGIHYGWHEEWSENYFVSDDKGDIVTDPIYDVPYRTDPRFPRLPWEMTPPSSLKPWMHMAMGSVRIPECYDARMSHTPLPPPEAGHEPGQHPNQWEWQAGSPVLEAPDCRLNLDGNPPSSVPERICRSPYTKAEIDRGIERARQYCLTGIYPPK